MCYLRWTKADILRLLSRGPRHGYAIARELKLTLSTVYEHVRDLESEGLVVTEQQGRRREIRLTPRGKALAGVLAGEADEADRRSKRQRTP